MCSKLKVKQKLKIKSSASQIRYLYVIWGWMWSWIMYVNWKKSLLLTVKSDFDKIHRLLLLLWLMMFWYICLSVCMSACMSACLSVCLSVYVCVSMRWCSWSILWSHETLRGRRSAVVHSLFVPWWLRWPRIFQHWGLSLCSLVMHSPGGSTVDDVISCDSSVQVGSLYSPSLPSYM